MNAVAMPSRRLFSLVAILALAGCTGAPGPTSVASPLGSLLPSSPGPTTLPSPTDIPAATSGPSLPPPTGAWQPAPSQTSLTGVQLQDVVWTGSRFMAVATGDLGGFFVDSTDGRTWRTHTVGARNGIPMRIAAGSGGTLVVIGIVGGSPASWASTDASHWTWHSRNFPASVTSEQVLKVTDVVATATGWLAVGRIDPVCGVACGTTPVRALAWTSPDGLTWTRVAAQAAFDGGGIDAVAATDAGFVAAGTAGGHAAIWTSSNGSSWARVPDDPVFGPPSGSGSSALVMANGVAAGQGSVVVTGMAFGAGPGGAPVVSAWRSNDGATWTPATVAGATGGQVFSVAATASRFLATGPSGEGSCLGGIWTSSDGADWACEAADPAFAGFGPYAAAGSPTIEVAVGLTSVGWDPNGSAGLPGAAWWRPAP